MSVYPCVQAARLQSAAAVNDNSERQHCVLSNALHSSACDWRIASAMGSSFHGAQYTGMPKRREFGGGTEVAALRIFIYAANSFQEHLESQITNTNSSDTALFFFKFSRKKLPYFELKSLFTIRKENFPF